MCCRMPSRQVRSRALPLLSRSTAARRYRARGWRDVEDGVPIERDTIFRIASMTKPITSVAALMLADEVRIALTDPISRWAPELSEMRVLRSPDRLLSETDACKRPITIEDLLT